MGQSIRDSSLILLLIGVLCVGILFQMLGMPLSFWDLIGSYDLIESSLLEVCAIVPAMPMVSPMFRSLYLCEMGSLAYRLSPQSLVFHPPLQLI